MNGVPEDEMQRAITDDIKSAFTGEDNAGEMLVLFNEPDQEPVQIDTMETTDLDEKFQSIMEAKEQDIFTAHKVTSPMLFGIRTEGQLGGRNEMIDAWELFKRTYIIPHQNIITGCLNSLLSVNWEDINISLEIIPPIEAEIDQSILTIEEKRKMQGLDDTELTSHQQTIMNLQNMPDSLQKAFVDSLSQEQLWELVGYDITDNTIEDTEDNFQAVQSSNLSDVVYDESTQVLTVTFTNGSVYTYDDVPEDVHQELMEASSKGSYFHENIRMDYNYTQIA